MSYKFYIGNTIQEIDSVSGPFDFLNFYKPKKKTAAPATAAAVAPGQNDPLIQYVYDQANKVHRLIVSAGISEPAASYGTYAAYHESGAFSSPLYKQHNNATGIKFAGQKGAVKGANGYAWFDSLGSWAAAYGHELKKGSNPAGAGSLADFAARLKKNGYYEDSYDNYLHGLSRARLVLKVIPAADRAGYDPATGQIQDKQDLDIPGSKDYSKFDANEWWGKRSNLEKGGIIAAALVVLIAATKAK